jgi:thiol-disulfide isomerase/thioredoxin
MFVNYFGTSWCGPCKIGKPYIKSRMLEFENDGHEIVFWDGDQEESQDIMERYSIEAFPTIVFVEKGEEKSRMKGWEKGKSEKIFEEMINTK